MTYLFYVPASLATGYSLLVVGSTASVGAALAARRGEVVLKTAVGFALPALVCVYVVRRIVMPMVPDDLGLVTKDTAVLVLFGALMLAASFSMIRSNTKTDDGGIVSPVQLAVRGALVGVVTGLTGAGGGFLIVPALYFFAKLDMKKAVGTSLCVIAANSLVGFIGDSEVWATYDWRLLLVVTLLAVGGMFVGTALRKAVKSEGLKKGFGWFVLVMGAFVVVSSIASN